MLKVQTAFGFSMGSLKSQKKSKSMSTAQTTERQISLKAISSENFGGRYIIQASNELSRQNHRLYRQGMDYKVNLRLMPPNTSSGVRFDIFTLPNTWFVKGAIKHAYETYESMLKDEISQGIKPARWHDFSIDEQNPDQTWSFARSAMFDGDAYQSLESDETISDSTIKDSSGQARGFHLLGAKGNSYNIFEEYAKVLKYNKPTSEARSSDQPYGELLQLDNADELAERGDTPPYDSDFSVMLPDPSANNDQALLVLRGSVSYDRDGGNVNLKSPQFVAPLGLIFVKKYLNGVANTMANAVPELLLEAAVGKYKGVHATSITCPE